eukprot:CAMPEP_0204629380 /NCGR_PEP_ID=MMETSP0717-20131115/18084_1 /ASSEMBLY_ACC=CAM_ASM_000666 /TAXON_ID=230516 /ORGANISM="Chaetoceros curvisetus" /LENGTH=548 /DNA_ID=CAMNT_0051646305 /DNA_START=59 /DNA_END=1705 /DNA_ORIENTATION=-
MKGTEFDLPTIVGSSTLDGVASFYSSDDTTCSEFIEVDRELNPTELYIKICNEDWEGALLALERNPLECQTWVVQRDPCSNEEEEDLYDDDGRDELVRFLPLHAACARRPPLDVVTALITSYPDGVTMVDLNGMFALHYACENQASAAVIELLLVRNLEANRLPATMNNGSLPIHLAAQCGVSSPEVMNILLEVDNDLTCTTDNDGFTPLDLALISKDYDGREEVIEILRNSLRKEVHLMASGDGDIILSKKSPTIQSRKGRRSWNTTTFSAMSKDSCDMSMTSIISDNFSTAALNPKRKEGRRGSTSPRRKMYLAERMMAELDAMREEITDLKAAKILREEGTREQTEREWKAVNMTLEKMERQIQEYTYRNKHSRNIKNAIWWESKPPITHDRLGASSEPLSRRDKLLYESRDDGDVDYDTENMRKRHSYLEQLSKLLSSTGKREQRGKEKMSKTPQLQEILQENINMKAEVRRLAAKRDSYEQQMKSMEQVIAEISKTVPLMMKKNEEAERKISMMTTTTSINTTNSRSRRDILKGILKRNVRFS